MISILLATADRPEMVEAFIGSLKDTTKGHEIELVAAVDGDADSALTLQRAGAIVDYREKHRGCSRAWNDALALSTGDPVVLAADDLHFEDGWLDAALAKLAEFPEGWGMVGFNDGHHGEELSTHYLMSRRFVVEVLGGVVAWPCYGHSFNDTEANERARAADRYAWCEEARVGHSHWLFGGRPMDETDNRAIGAHAESERIFKQRQAEGFPDIEAVITA